MSHWPSGPGLFHGTYHAAKGLEFDSVFLPHLSASEWPDPKDIANIGAEEVARRDSKLLYVGITRARSTLVLTHTGSPTRFLPRDVDLYQA